MGGTWGRGEEEIVGLSVQEMAGSGCISAPLFLLLNYLHYLLFIPNKQSHATDAIIVPTRQIRKLRLL